MVDCRTMDRDCRRLAKRVREVPKPPSRSVWYAVGANKFQEHELLLDLFEIEQIYSNPFPSWWNTLEKATAIWIMYGFSIALTDHEGIADFHITNNLESSSLLEVETTRKSIRGLKKGDKSRLPKTWNGHARIQPGVPDLLFIDVQSAEYRIISSLTDKLLSSLKLLYTEASTIEFYKGAKSERYSGMPEIVFISWFLG